MKVRLTVEVGARARYVIAKYYGRASARATRAEVRAFVAGAVSSAVREQAAALPRRQRSTADRLVEAPDSPAPLVEPNDKQTTLRFQ